MHTVTKYGDDKHTTATHTTTNKAKKGKDKCSIF